MIEAEPEVRRRLWLVFFGNSAAYWWSRFLKPGFRHVSAASWYAEEQRWVFVDPTSRGLIVEIRTAEEMDGRLGQLIRDSSAILRVAGRTDQRGMPLLSWYCVGTVKSLLGLRSCALLPYSLYAHLLSIGAEAVDVPATDEHTEAPAGRPEARSTA